MKIKKEPVRCISVKSENCIGTFREGDVCFLILRIGSHDAIPCCIQCLKVEAVGGFVNNIVGDILGGFFK